MRPNSDNIFEGRWEITLSEYFTAEGLWDSYHQFEAGEYVLEFSPCEPVEIGRTLRYKGQVMEHGRDHSTLTTTYCLDIEAELSTLTIDRSTCHDDGSLDICYEECYTFSAIEPAPDGRHSLWLSLINAPDCPAPCFRLRLSWRNLA